MRTTTAAGLLVVLLVFACHRSSTVIGMQSNGLLTFWRHFTFYYVCDVSTIQQAFRNLANTRNLLICVLCKFAENGSVTSAETDLLCACKSACVYRNVPVPSLPPTYSMHHHHGEKAMHEEQRTTTVTRVPENKSHNIICNLDDNENLRIENGCYDYRIP